MVKAELQAAPVVKAAAVRWKSVADVVPGPALEKGAAAAMRQTVGLWLMAGPATGAVMMVAVVLAVLLPGAMTMER